MEKVYFSSLKTSLKSMEEVKSDERFFEGLLTVEMKDKQGEVTIVDELYKVLPIWMDRGAPISDTHSNRIIGKGINFARTSVRNDENELLPAIKITGKIYNDYELDNLIWQKIKNGEYKGLSFGGATRTNRTPMRMKDGSMAYALKELEHYEVAVCKDPAVPMAIITDVNGIAKAHFGDNATERGDGKMVVQCTSMGCYIEKADLSEEDTFEQKVRKLESEGKSRESAEKIVGSFVKRDSSAGDKPEDSDEKEDQSLSAINERTKEDKEEEERDHADSDGDSSSMYNQNVDRESSSGLKIKNLVDVINRGGNAARGKGELYVPIRGNFVEEEPDVPKPKKASDTTVQQTGGIRTNYNTVQQGSMDPTDGSAHITEHKVGNNEHDKDKYPAEKETQREEEDRKIKEKDKSYKKWVVNRLL